MISIEGVRTMDECRLKGILLRAEDGRIRWTAPSGAMDLDLLKRIKSLEAELVDSLNKQQAANRRRLYMADPGARQ